MEYTQIGYISKQHGLRGNLLLNLFSDYKISITKIKYLFVEMNLENVRWRSIQSTMGVLNLVCFGDKPIPVPQNVITILKSCEDENCLIKFVGQSRFDPGDEVQILDGAFGDSIGVIKEKYSHDRVTLLLKMMGRQIRVNTSIERILPVG